MVANQISLVAGITLGPSPVQLSLEMNTTEW